MARRVTQSTRRLLPRAETHDARRLLGAAVRRAEGGLLPPVCLLPLGLRQPRRGGGGCPPLFVSDMSASPGKFCSPSAGSEGAPGYRLRINEAANYIHLLRGSVPSNDPQHLRVPPPPPPPISFVFQKKELIIRKSHVRRTNGRDLRRKITREYHFSPPTVWSRTPHRKPARLLRDPTEPHAARARHTTTES